MKKVTFSGLVFLCAFFVLSMWFGWGGCTEERVVPPWPTDNQVTITMVNSTDEYTHMWTNGEKQNAGNKLVPWLSREKVVTLTYESAESTPSLYVAVGRNGSELKRSSIAVPYQDSPYPLRCYYANFRISGIIEFEKVDCQPGK